MPVEADPSGAQGVLARVQFEVLSSSASSDVCKSSPRISRHTTVDPGDTRDGRAEDEGIAVAVAERQIEERNSQRRKGCLLFSSKTQD